jgi:multicomponent Na+:H+ antiporter subunit E
LWLLPPETGRVRIFMLLLLLPRFLWNSLLAGVDVARRAFMPSLPLDPGFVDYPVDLPRGSARNAFELISSLLPGSVPTDETEATIEYHCLDVQQPVVEQLAAEERAHAPALVPGRRHG